MKLENGNTITGIYNADLVPVGTVFTTNDIVLYGNVLYLCKGETTTLPNITEDQWGYYLSSLDPISTIEDSEAPGTENKLVTLNLVRELLMEMNKGCNLDGTLKVLTVGDINEVPVNSVYRVTADYLTSSGIYNPVGIPNSNSIFILKTVKGLVSGEETNLDLPVYQELKELQSTGKLITWVRSGLVLKNSLWSSLQPKSNATKYLNYLESITTKYLEVISEYEGFKSSMKDGEYNFWRSVKGNDIDYTSGKIEFSNSYYSKSKFYRIYFVVESLGDTYSSSIDVTPGDHEFLQTSEELKYSGVDGLVLTKRSLNVSDLTIPVGVTITRMLISDTVII